jgi:predicted Zn-dependent peptidase
MFIEKKLKNGINVVLAPLKDTKAVTALVLVKVGSRHETKVTNGMAHFLEHMMFKGTKKRPTTLHISHELDSIGASYNAFTGKDHTGYYIKADVRELPLLLDMLSDLLLNATLPDVEIQREKNVIVEEINMYEDNPMMFIGDLFERLLYDGSKLGWEIAGTREGVRAMTRKQMVDFRTAFYHPARITIGIAGNIDDTLFSDVEKLFGRAKKKPFGKTFTPYTHKQKKPRVRILKKQTEQVHLALGFPAFKRGDKRLPALHMLHAILGGTMSSRLFIAVRERQGLCYYVRSGVDTLEDTGSFVVTAGLSADKIEKAITIIMRELKKIRDKGVTKKELDKAKHNLRGKSTLALEETSAVVDWYARQTMFGDKIKTPDQKIAEVFTVTREDVQKVARQVIDFQRTNLAMIGPFDDEKPFLDLISIK